jgi:hypothetical protein
VPRLTNAIYLEQHELLRLSRGESHVGFAPLTPNEQWDLFRYYLPHQVRPDQALFEHRVQITTLDPSLPQRAGRAFHHWRRIEAALPAYQACVAKQPHSTSQKDRRVKAFSEVNPELDPKKFAEIIIELARQGQPPGCTSRERRGSRARWFLKIALLGVVG